MRKSLVLATLALLVCSAAAFAGIPDPSRSGCEVTGQPLACQFRFNNAGTLDKLTLKVTLRDNFDQPVAACATTCNLDNATQLAKVCGGNQKAGVTDGGGVVHFIYRCIGGKGSVDLKVTACGNIPICTNTINFASTDQNASRDTDNGAHTSLDWAVWGLCFEPNGTYCLTSDLNCDTRVNSLDAALMGTSWPNVTCANCP